jgi:hypothetical protein
MNCDPGDLAQRDPAGWGSADGESALPEFEISGIALQEMSGDRPAFVDDALGRKDRRAASIDEASTGPGSQAIRDRRGVAESNIDSVEG